MFKLSFKKIIFSLLFIFTFFSVALVDSNATDYGMETKSYDVKAKISKDGYIDVEETILVNFLEERHGIYMYISTNPEGELKYNGKTYDSEQRLKVKNIEVSSDAPSDYETEINSDFVSIKIGDPDETVSGEKKYNIKYRLEFSQDIIKDFDTIAYNLYPSGWATDIESFTASVDYPSGYLKNEKGEREVYYVPSEGFKFTYESNGNNFKMKSDGPVVEGSFFQISAYYPQGFFKNAHTPADVFNDMFIFIIVLLVIAIIFKFVFGRRKKAFETVEFRSPDNLSPAEIGYIVDRTIDQSDIISLIIYFANKGLLDIEGSKKEELVLVKKQEIPYDYPEYERIFFDGLFASGDGQRVQISSIGDEFAEVYEDTVSSLERRFKEPNRKLKSRSNTILRKIGMILSLIPGFIFALTWVADGLPKLVLGIVLVLYLVIESLDRTFKKRDITSKTLYIGKMISFSLLFFVILTISPIIVNALVYHSILSTSFVFAIVKCALLNTVVMFIFNLIDRRSKYLQSIIGRILGFRNFIEKAEVEKLNMLVNEDPEYFYDILPYAYSLGLSDRWINSFESIPISAPNWGRGFYSSGAFDVIYFSTYFSMLESSLSTGLPTSIPNNSAVTGAAIGGAIGGAMGGRGGGSW